MYLFILFLVYYEFLYVGYWGKINRKWGIWIRYFGVLYMKIVNFLLWELMGYSIFWLKISGMWDIWI